MENRKRNMRKILVLKFVIKLTFGLEFNFQFSNKSIDSGALKLESLNSDVIYSRDLDSNSNNIVAQRCIELIKEQAMDSQYITFLHSCSEDSGQCIDDENTNQFKTIASQIICPISGLLTTADFYLHKQIIYIIISGCFNTNHKNETQHILWVMTNRRYIDYSFYNQAHRFDITNLMTFDRYHPNKDCSNLCLPNRCDGAENMKSNSDSSSLGSSNIV